MTKTQNLQLGVGMDGIYMHKHWVEAWEGK